MPESSLRTSMHSGLSLGEADDPVIAVAAHVDEAAAVGDIVFLRIEHALGDIFGMGAGDDAVVGAQNVDAFAMQIFIGDVVAVVAHVVDPGDDREIGRKLPGDVHARHAVFRPHVDDRTQIGREADAGAILEMVVGRQAVFAVLVGLDVEIGDDRRLAGHRLDDLRVEAQALIGIGEIACGRHEEAELALGLARPDDEDDVFLGNADARPDAQPHGIDAALAASSGTVMRLVTSQRQSVTLSGWNSMPPYCDGARRKQSSLPFQFQPVMRADRMVHALGIELVRAGVDDLRGRCHGRYSPPAVSQ